MEKSVCRGKVIVKGKIFYTDFANPIFVEGSTIEENIRFGKRLNKIRMENILTLVGLSRLSPKENLDFNIETIVVQKNARNLSRILKIKLLFARMCYLDSEIYLIHNFTSSLQTTEHSYFQLFKHIVVGYMFNKTIIFDSTWRDFLKLSDKICIVEKNSSVVFFGRYFEFIQNPNLDSY